MRSCILSLMSRRRTAAPLIGAWVLAALSACSRTTEPDALGQVALRLELLAPGGPPVTVPAQVLPDSMVVRVFRGGQGVTREVSRGAAISGTGSVEMSVTCIAESGKKVSVELFERGTMVYFGVDEQVDVAANERTDVLIDARDIHIDGISVNPQTVIVGTAYTVAWSPPPAAESYLLVESTDPDFIPAATQTFLTTDTEMTFQRPAGAYYYTVAPVNSYAVGTLAGVVFCYVQSVGEPPPQVDSVDPPEAAPGDVVTLHGTNLDLPGSRVFIGAVPCPLVGATGTELHARVGLNATTGTMTLQTVLGTVDVPGTFVVDRIAYVTGTGGDAEWYAALLAGDAGIRSGLAAVDIDAVADRDMSVFDAIVVANDASGGPSGPDAETVAAIAGSGAGVLAVGAGGYAYLARLFPEIEGALTTRELRQTIFVPDGTLPIFQQPNPVAPLGPATVEMCSSSEPFRGIGIDVLDKPDFVTLYAALSVQQPQSFVLLDAEWAQAPTAVHVLYWGYEGGPESLTTTGADSVLNLFHYLLGLNDPAPVTASRAR